MDQKLLVGFSSLFWGQSQCYFDLKQMKTIWKPLNVDVFYAHLKGEIELGVYCTNDQNLSYWGCIDFDAPEKTKSADSKAYQLAIQVRSQYEEAGIQVWIERSKSKGYHLWVFPQQPMQSRMLRDYQLSILERIGIHGVEVNPKQNDIWHTAIPKTAPNWRRFGIGNLVRIPYSPLANSGRMCFLDRSYRPMGLCEWLPKALASRPAVDSLSRTTRPAESPTYGSPGKGSSDARSSSAQEAWQVWKGDRELYEGERDNQFFTLAKLLRANGVLKSEAEREVKLVYQEKVLDKSSFTLQHALDKVRRVYES